MYNVKFIIDFQMYLKEYNEGYKKQFQRNTSFLVKG